MRKYVIKNKERNLYVKDIRLEAVFKDEEEYTEDINKAYIFDTRGDALDQTCTDRKEKVVSIEVTLTEVKRGKSKSRRA